MKLPNSIARHTNGGVFTDVSGRSVATTYRVEVNGRVIFLKIGAVGTLRREAEMTRIFGQRRLSAEVVEYDSTEISDYLLTTDIGGKSGIASEHLSDPKRLVKVYAESLRSLHDCDFSGCDVTSPCMDISSYDLGNLEKLNTDYSSCLDICDINSAKFALEFRHLLQPDVMLHGDYCLPNILLDDFKFRGFVDLGEGGFGDRHFDIFWGIWSTAYNLRTDDYREYFCECYGRDKIDERRLKVCGVLMSL